MSRDSYKLWIVLVGALMGVGQTMAQPSEHFLDLLPVAHAAGGLAPVEQGAVPPDQRLGPGGIGYATHGSPPASPFTF
jgi:hypothetical protein